MVKKLALLALALGLVLSFAGCDNFFLGGDTGTLAIYLADMPVNDVAEVNVTLSKVEVKRDNEWVEIRNFEEDDDHDGKFDLLTLRFDEALLGEEYFEPGLYNQIRLIIAAPEAPENDVPPYEGQGSYIVKKDSPEEKIPIFVPSGTQTGLKINHEFSIEADTITELILDVDVRDMLVKAGESGIIILGPTSIKVIDKVISGEITGRVLADDDNDGTVIDDVDVIIKAFKEDDDPAAEAVASTEEVNGVPAGSFKLRGLLPGDYYLTVEAEGYKTTETIDDIAVLEGETTQLEETIFLEEESNDD